MKYYNIIYFRKYNQQAKELLLEGGKNNANEYF